MAFTGPAAPPSRTGPAHPPERQPASAPSQGGPEPDRPPPGTTGERAWPVTGPTGVRPTIARGWEPPPAPWAAGHRGVDLSATRAATVRAAAPGRVLFAGKVAGRGVLSIEVAASGRPPLRTTYEPVRPTVRKGAHVTAGQPVATLAPGPFHCSGPCLHWGLLRDKTYLDPLSLLPASMLRPVPARLLPVIGIPEPEQPPSDLRGAPQHSHPRRATAQRARAQAQAQAQTPPRARARARAQRIQTRPPPHHRRENAAGQPLTPPRTMATAASVICVGSSAAPSSIRRTAASTTP
ncbi:M23 family metallopeptidase [Streptomyces sp. NPDC007100]|uniref:M23 family metallopeptidase n=1 Tax=Streptomyces sp. NPDC007100 TaxID=3155602 RepID=UPI0033F85E71